MDNSASDCPGGGIGRRSGFKIRRRKVCQFESGPGHQLDRKRLSAMKAFFFSRSGNPCATLEWAKLRLMLKRILRKYKYPPDQQDAAVELVLQPGQLHQNGNDIVVDPMK